MHTAEALDRPDIRYRSDGRPVSRDAVLPPIDVTDRVGIVTETGTGGLGAGAFLLSCVTAFYDRLRETAEGFFEYPNYYTFQTTAEPADYGMLDVYPSHKNVSVEADAERLLRAITDRAVSILVVPDGEPRTPPSAIDDVTRRSAERRIEHCYAYAPDGDLDDAEFSIRHPRQPAEEWYRAVFESAGGGSAAYRTPSTTSGGEEITQGFRRISVERALTSLPG
ncbi:hypothetical protein [Halobellus salinisoli]|uniref:hypothetical protein n=1 Tax=Halobellus salinisoli TaxID=3108500 RepID=UPI00300A10BD